LYQKLLAEGWIDPWLDEEKLLPGQDWDLEIEKAVETTDVVIVCLSDNSLNKEGYIQKEIRKVLDVSDQKLDSTIFIIPLRFESCEVPRRLTKWQWVDYFKEGDQQKLVRALESRAKSLSLQVTKSILPLNHELFQFIKIPPIEKIPYSFYISKYPITNSQYQRFINTPDYVNSLYWMDFPKFDEKCEQLGNWGEMGFKWLQRELKKLKSNVLRPPLWDDKYFGISNPNNPIVGVSWYEANAYCKWLYQNWNSLSESKAHPDLRPILIRLPLETEWLEAAGGELPRSRYPWDETGITTSSLKEILRRANIEESVIEHTTPVTAYPLGKSPFGVIDMSGNVWEWQANFYAKDNSRLAVRGGSWDDNQRSARVSSRYYAPPGYSFYYDIGFRVAVFIDN
jgi:formylglycine-generating enzyme required for sulfatase activity